VRTSALVRVAAVLTTTFLAGALLAQPAQADDSPLPVVGPDTVTLYPGQSTEVDVLDNDSSPDGDALALCRFPEDGMDGGMRSVWFTTFGENPGAVLVSAMPKARGTHTIDYFVCDHKHLVPATLTVVIRDVEPVDVTKVADRPGRLQVTNHNQKPIRFWFGHPQGRRTDGRVRIAAGDTTTVRVQRHTIVWIALIGGGSIKGALNTPAIADFGYVRHIKLDGAALPAPHGVGHRGSPTTAKSFVARWR
jgi:hypothetical protein